MKKTFWIEFIGDRSVKIEEGQTILEASLLADIPHYHACGGKAKCSTCRILVKEGSEYLTPYNSKEAALRRMISFPSDVRLACQTYVTGPQVKLHRLIRDETDIGLYITNNFKEDLVNIGEERELALFFLDIRNFTTFMVNYLAFDVIHVMRRLFSLFRACIEKHNGQIIETAGDGFYAVFGFEQTRQQAANDACGAAFTIQKELQYFNDQYLTKHFLHRFDVGIGIHVGRVIIGNIGIGVNNNLTVMGLPVNIASRLQGATKELNNSIVVSADTYQLLYEKPEASHQDTLLKGIRNKVHVYLLGHAYTND
ncbi:MAG TPA: adenylate/guanylate cyclase domain-containing protein [Flavisolibacter sp.]|nr:adenylate/guanylate cyclase domain-containing protein [Flavisolibacter sp.]